MITNKNNTRQNTEIQALFQKHFEISKKGADKPLLLYTPMSDNAYYPRSKNTYKPSLSQDSILFVKKSTQEIYTRLQVFTFLIETIIRERGKCSYAHSSFAQILHVSRRTILRYMKVIEDDSRFKISKKYWCTNWITFSCLAALSASFLLCPVTLFSFKFEYININSLTYSRKRGLSDHAIKKERKKWEWLRERIKMDTNKLFKDQDSQPNYAQQQKQQQGEMSKSLSTIKVPPNWDRILITQAKKLSDHVERGITTPSIALRKLGNLKRDCPHAIEPFKKWMNTSEGRQIMAILAASS